MNHVTDVREDSTIIEKLSTMTMPCVDVDVYNVDVDDCDTSVSTYWDRCFDTHHMLIDKSNPPWNLKYDKNRGFYAISNRYYKRGTIYYV